MDGERTLAINGLHATHSEIVCAFGTLAGCTACRRIVGLRCGYVTFVGRNACLPAPDREASAPVGWALGVTYDSGPEGRHIIATFRAALRGGGGGRHAADS